MLAADDMVKSSEKKKEINNIFDHVNNKLFIIHTNKSKQIKKIDKSSTETKG